MARKFILHLIPIAARALVFIVLPGTQAGNAGDLGLKIVKTPMIMAAARNVYANPTALDGKYFLCKASGWGGIFLMLVKVAWILGLLIAR